MRREEILAAMREHQVVVIAGETGSGKTTQLPKMCLEAGMAERGLLGCTQPRRVAAMSVSRRVAEEMQTPWGGVVGCRMRFSDDTSRSTRVKFMTDGILLAEIQSDPLLRRYTGIIIDEAHERSLNIDFLLGHLKGILTKRSDLRLVITSATIDTQAFSRAFGNAPIIEVSGRMWPVEIRFQPPEEWGYRGEEEPDFVEAAARATEDAMEEFPEGDVLIFMPTERDIRDTADILSGRLGQRTEVLPLFGRMAQADQQRIFSPGSKRRVVIATNVAETSVTIPRIRVVIDSGLARISRYAPRTRTKRLPVEDIAQSSANQRAGRAGRVQEGLCIRLYSQEDYEKRPLFTMPEIQRANLAEVILRMKAFRLGEIETFPFIDPPAHPSIRAGYALLHELGALDETERLTELGHRLAQLPIDPVLGRMLLQAQEERVLPEVLVIAAGLSIPDPRERPEEQKEKAAAAHKAFSVPTSDFLTLLNIWLAAPDRSASTNALRKFCRQNFLSWVRMREWRDLHRQLVDAMNDDEESDLPALSREANDDGIHRSILAGLVGQIATKDERNVYKASGERMVMVFPGSALHERRERKQDRKPAADGKDKAEKSQQPPWIMAAEIVQTSQLFARTVARIDPVWIEKLAPHLCEHRFSEPVWEENQGRVLATERVLVHGMEIRRGRVDYVRINAQAATEIFIRSALLEESAAVTQRFAEENRRLCARMKAALAHSRTGRVWAVEEALFSFYARRLEKVGGVADLNRRAKELGELALLATETDLVGTSTDIAEDLEKFPDSVEVGNSVLPLDYCYRPGHESDGVTVEVPLPVAAVLTSGQVQWMVPGLRTELIGVLLRALPKRHRRELQPMEPKIAETVAHFSPGRGEFLPTLAAFLTKRFGIEIQAADWPPDSLPPHLQPRVTVVNEKRETVVASRDFQEIRAAAEKAGRKSSAWEQTAAKWERPAVSGWTFGDLPDSVAVEIIAGTQVSGFPGLRLRERDVDVHLFRTRAEVIAAAPPAIRRLAEMAMGKDIAWLERDLRSLTLGGGAAPKKPASFQDALTTVSAKLAAPGSASSLTADLLQRTAHEHILRHVLRLDPVLPLKEERFTKLVESARKNLPLVLAKLRELVRQILDLRTQILSSAKRYSGMDADAARLVPPDFLLRTPHERLVHLPRYLRAILVRAERAVLQPAKDAERALQLEPFLGWEADVPEPNREPFRWLFEEFRVSIFAQELGTAQPASAKRLEALLELS